MVQTFSQCVLGSADDMDLDELLATKLVTFMMEHHNIIFQVPTKLRCQVDEHLSHLKRAQVSVFSTLTKNELMSCASIQKEVIAGGLLQLLSVVTPSHFLQHLRPPIFHVHQAVSVNHLLRKSSVILQSAV